MQSYFVFGLLLSDKSLFTAASVVLLYLLQRGRNRKKLLTSFSTHTHWSDGHWQGKQRGIKDAIVNRYRTPLIRYGVLTCEMKSFFYVKFHLHAFTTMLEDVS